MASRFILLNPGPTNVSERVLGVLETWMNG